MLWAIPIAIISARIYYVIFEWDYYSQNLGDIPKIWNGGIAIHGALIGSVITALYLRKKENLLLADCGYCCTKYYSWAGDWKMGKLYKSRGSWWRSKPCFLENLYLPDFIINQMYINGAYYHPTFLYESSGISWYFLID